MSIPSFSSTLMNFVASQDEIELANKFLDLDKWTCSDTLSIDMAIGILKQNGLSYTQIREMWKVADRNATGILSRNEVTILIRLMGWVQAGKSVDRETPFLLDRQGPLPEIRGINYQEESQSNDPVFSEPHSARGEAGQTTGFEETLTTPRSLPGPSDSETEDSLLKTISSISFAEWTEFEDIFFRFKPKEGCLNKRDVMAIYLDALPGLSFGQLYQIMRLLRGSDPGMMDFKSFVIGFCIIKSLKTGRLINIPTSIPDEVFNMPFRPTRQRISELSVEAEQDILDLMQDIERQECISSEMSQKFRQKYQVLPFELYRFWNESRATFGNIINGYRLAMLARLVRERLLKRSQEIPSAGISNLPRNVDAPSPAQDSTVTPPPPQYRSRTYSTAAIAFNGVINEISKLTQHFDDTIKAKEREHRVIREAHAALEREHSLVKSRENDLQECLAGREIELKETKQLLSQAIPIASNTQSALDECRVAINASKEYIDELQSMVQLQSMAWDQKNQLSEHAELQQKLQETEADKCRLDIEVEDLRQILAAKDIQVLTLHDIVAELSKGATKPSNVRESGWPLPALSGLHPNGPQNKYRQEGNDTNLQAGTQASALASPSHSDTPIRDFLRKRPTSLLMVSDDNLQKHFSTNSRYLHTISEISIPDDTEEEEKLADSKLYEQFLRDMDLLKVDVEEKGCVSDDVLEIFELEYGFGAEDLAVFQKLASIKDGSPDMDDFKHAVSVIRDRLKDKGGPWMDSEGDQAILSGALSAASFSRVMSLTGDPSNEPTLALPPEKSGYMSAESEKARFRQMLDNKPVEDQSLLPSYSDTIAGPSGYLSAAYEEARHRQLPDSRPVQGTQDSAVFPESLWDRASCALRFHLPKPESNQLAFEKGGRVRTRAPKLGKLISKWLSASDATFRSCL
ncbi:hypothetical protein D9613_010463 [Agrocybe pediades]|uniref:Uncharacterized protein n=1 Tax=Agrocybe pediades TaxID=84607 RepID=A0A8H4QFK4_9AGAR|nr:hypothetical protein D9613_010463 [Agrocybe pediades]